VSRIIPVSLVARLLVERPDSRGSIPGCGGGDFYVTVSCSTLPPLQWAWAVTNRAWTYNFSRFKGFLKMPTFAKIGNTTPVIYEA